MYYSKINQLILNAIRSCGRVKHTIITARHVQNNRENSIVFKLYLHWS